MAAAGRALERSIKILWLGDDLAMEASGNTAWFRERMSANVARVIVVAPGQFEVIRRSVKKTDRNDEQAIAFSSARGCCRRRA